MGTENTPQVPASVLQGSVATLHRRGDVHQVLSSQGLLGFVPRSSYMVYMESMDVLWMFYGIHGCLYVVYVYIYIYIYGINIWFMDVYGHPSQESGKHGYLNV